jgi:hypothetical protein
VFKQHWIQSYELVPKRSIAGGVAAESAFRNRVREVTE